jgi:hypothetical protein
MPLDRRSCGLRPSRRFPSVWAFGWRSVEACSSAVAEWWPLPYSQGGRYSLLSVGGRRYALRLRGVWMCSWLWAWLWTWKLEAHALPCSLKWLWSRVPAWHRSQPGLLELREYRWECFGVWLPLGRFVPLPSVPAEAFQPCAPRMPRENPQAPRQPIECPTNAGIHVCSVSTYTMCPFTTRLNHTLAQNTNPGRGHPVPTISV